MTIPLRYPWYISTIALFLTIILTAQAKHNGGIQSVGGTGKITTEMHTAKIFLDLGWWDFVGKTENGTEDIWWIFEDQDYPRLWWELVPEN